MSFIITLTNARLSPEIQKFPGQHQVHPTVLYTNTLLLSWIKEVKIQCLPLNRHLWVLLLLILHFGSFLQLLELYQQL